MKLPSYEWAIVACLVSCAVSVVVLVGLPTTDDGRLERAPDAQG